MRIYIVIEEEEPKKIIEAVDKKEYDALELQHKMLRKELQEHIDKCRNFHISF